MIILNVFFRKLLFKIWNIIPKYLRLKFNLPKKRFSFKKYRKFRHKLKTAWNSKLPAIAEKPFEEYVTSKTCVGEVQYSPRYTNKLYDIRNNSFLSFSEVVLNLLSKGRTLKEIFDLNLSKKSQNDNVNTPLNDHRRICNQVYCNMAEMIFNCPLLRKQAKKRLDYASLVTETLTDYLCIHRK